jgi:hypothetical protein
MLTPTGSSLTAGYDRMSRPVWLHAAGNLFDVVLVKGAWALAVGGTRTRHDVPHWRRREAVDMPELGERLVANSGGLPSVWKLNTYPACVLDALVRSVQQAPSVAAGRTNAPLEDARSNIVVRKYNWITERGMVALPARRVVCHAAGRCWTTACSSSTASLA